MAKSQAKRRSRDVEEKPARKTRASAEKPTKRKAAEEKPARKTRASAEKPTRRTKAADEKPVRKTRASSAEKPARKKRGEEPAPKRGRKAAEEAPAKKKRGAQAEEPTPRKKTRGKGSSEDGEVCVFNPYAQLDDTLDAIEKHIGLTDSSMDKSERRMSTGLLMNDLILGGGITAGWYTNFGQEQTCKTTDAVTMLAAAVNANVPIISYWDYEGSATPDYIENIMRNMGLRSDVKSLFGVRDEKSGKWIVPPRVRYKSEGVAEKFFDYVAQLQRKLPDKKKIGDGWYYIYAGKTPDGKIHKANAAIVGKNYDVAYYKKTGNYRVPAPDGSLQAVILVDSYPAMLPESQDVDDPKSGMAAQARMFAEQLKRVKGKMRAKRMAVLGINQLRLRPAVMMGNPEYEPCGEALKLFSDVRLKHTARALSAISKAIGETVKGQGQIEEEKSVTYKGGVDHYRYINVRAHKNKLSRPYLEAWLRLWITDGKGNAQGFDPVFDTFMYLRNTGQLVGKRNKMLLQFKGNEAKKYIGWMDFKNLILGDKKSIAAICTAAGMKPVKLRDKCFAQVNSGVGIELFNQAELDNRNRKAEKEASKGEDDEDGDDDND